MSALCGSLKNDERGNKVMDERFGPLIPVPDVRRKIRVEAANRMFDEAMWPSFAAGLGLLDASRFDSAATTLKNAHVALMLDCFETRDARTFRFLGLMPHAFVMQDVYADLAELAEIESEFVREADLQESNYRYRSRDDLGELVNYLGYTQAQCMSEWAEHDDVVALMEPDARRLLLKHYN